MAQASPATVGATSPQQLMADKSIYKSIYSTLCSSQLRLFLSRR